MKKNKALQVLVFDKDLANEEFLKKFNGFIIPGGGDTYPEDKEFTLDDVPEGSMTEGEKLYKTVLAIADKYSIPLMGMCLGNQYIGLHAGATLNATIGHNGGLHKGLFIKGTMPYFMSLSLYEQNQVLHDYDYPNVEFHIDTAHNFGILGNKPGQLTVGAYSEEGVVQSVSYKNHIIGFQFYPENYYARESSSDFAVRSINLIDNFLSLATQHFQWHDFANGKGFAYQEAQEALQASNQNLMKLINAPLQESSCAPSDILKLSTCNSTRAEFKWPEPALEDFSRNLGESHEVILGEAVEVLG
jgi:gamma-glutamyl-gamma-aminobutyrate hydrolase PuuD